jgi:hypothetical protein
VRTAHEKINALGYKNISDDILTDEGAKSALKIAQACTHHVSCGMQPDTSC